MEDVEKQEVPAVGPGSPRGWRWFSSCRYPHLSITITPAQMKTDTLPPVKGRYLKLEVSTKPDQFVGEGRRGTDNFDGTDLNDSPYWGIAKVYDPGPEPEDGFTDDGKDVPRSERFTAKAKKDLRLMVDHIRETDFYRHTRQDNELDKDMQLKETNWDPTPFSGKMRGYIARGRQTITREGVKQVAAPAETRPEVPKVRVPSLGRPHLAAVQK